MRKTAAADLRQRVQQDAGAGPVIGARRRVAIPRDDPIAPANRLRADAQRNRIDVGHQQPPWPADRSRQFDDQVPRLAAERAALVGRVFHHGRCGDSNLPQMRANRREDLPFLAALARNGHELRHQLDGRRRVDFQKFVARLNGSWFHDMGPLDSVTPDYDR